MACAHIVLLLFITFVALCRATYDICPHPGYYRIPNPQSKISFYVCSNGHPDLNYCPNGYYFDGRLADCVAASGYSQNNNLDYNNVNYKNTRSNYENKQSQYNNNYNNQNGKYSQNTRSNQQYGYGNNVQQQSSGNYQQNGYGNIAEQQSSRNYQQRGYGNSVQQQNSRNSYSTNAQQQNSYRSTQSQSRNIQQESNSRSELEVDAEVNRQNEDRLQQNNNSIQRVICPRVITGSAVLMPNDEDQSTYFVCQRSGARRLLRCPEGTKFNVGMKVCLSSTVNSNSSSRSVSRKQAISEHW